MAWNDLSLPDKARMMQLAVKSGITDLRTIQEVYNKYAEGGPVERRIHNGTPISEEGYKQMQRDTIIDAAVQKALTRDRGIAPVINGEPGMSCIYTVTDNFGNQYRVMGNQTFSANPEKYGFTVNGPVENAKVGDLYQMINESGTPNHMTLITGRDESGNPLVSYSSGEAVMRPMSKEEFDKIPTLGNQRETYEQYINRVKQAELKDYHKNSKLWDTPGYETYRFIGTPKDNQQWSEQFGLLPEAEQLPEVNNYATDLLSAYHLSKGGKIYIKPKNRGKFTALKKRTGKSASWFKAHGTPAQRKMATFALNARKWKHGEGGYLGDTLLQIP